MSRIARKRAYLSAAFINDAKQPLMPGGRGVPLQAGDVVELGVHPIQSVTGQRTLRLVVEAVGDADGAAGGPPPSYIAAALRDHCAKDKVAAADSVSEPSSTPSSPSLKERLSSGPEAAIFGLRSEVVKDPGNTGEEGGGGQPAIEDEVVKDPGNTGEEGRRGRAACCWPLAPNCLTAWVRIAVRTRKLFVARAPPPLPTDVLLLSMQVPGWPGRRLPLARASFSSRAPSSAPLLSLPRPMYKPP